MSRATKIAVAVCIVAGSAAYLLYKNRADMQLKSLYLQNENYPVRTNLFESYKTGQADIVMLGNSLTQWVDWNELLGRTNVVNRGIASDVTEGYLHRLEQIYKLKPKLCFIEGGINDLYANASVDVVYQNYMKIVEGLRANSIIPIIQSTLFASPKWHDAIAKNKEVAELNARLEDYARKNSIEFINLNAVMSKDNLLRDELTHDGIHLTAAGYKIWGTGVEKILKKHRL
jgi:lysophospholipase L1-like esterase